MLRDLLLLTRAPLAASATANALVGCAAAGALTGAPPLALLAAGSAAAAAYLAGMALNDWFDLERDRRLYPRRPLPSGRVPPALGLGLGVALLVLGALLAGATSVAAGLPAARGLAPGLLLAACVVAYDGVLKAWRWPGAIAMAACRAVNGAGAAVALGAGAPLGYAALLFVFVLGLTLVSTWEDEEAPPAAVAGAWGTVALAPLLLLLAVVKGALGPAALLAALPLGAVVAAEGVAVVVRGSVTRGEAPTRTLLRAVWLVDLAVLLGLGAWAGAGLLVVAHVAARLAAGALFAPPRAAETPRHTPSGDPG